MGLSFPSRPAGYVFASTNAWYRFSLTHRHCSTCDHRRNLPSCFSHALRILADLEHLRGVAAHYPLLILWR
jgi:hypothetical protein